MAKTVLITIEVKSDPKKVKEMETAITSLGGKVKSSSATQKKSFEEVSNTLDALGNRFRYLSLVAGMAAGAMTMMVRGFVKDAMELEQSQMKLGAFAIIAGHSFDEANDLAKKFAREGIMSVTEASNTLANLLATGLGMDKAEDLMRGAQDMAVLAKESLTDTTGQAMEKFSLGMRIMQERMIDAVGVNFVAINVWKKYGDTIDKTTNQMTNADKEQAMYIYLMEKFEKVQGAAEIAAMTFTGTMNRLKVNTNQASSALGDTLLPIIGPLAELFIKAANGLRMFAEENKALTAVVLIGATVVVTLVAAVAMLGALVPMVTGKMAIGVTALKSMSFAAVMVVAKFVALAMVIGTLIYLVAKATGTWDSFAKKLSELQQKMADTLKATKDVNEEFTDPKVLKQLKKLQDQMALTTRSFNESMAQWVRKHDETVTKLKSQINDLKDEYTKAVNKITSSFKDSQESSELSHRRKVEDLQRAIDEEISLGIWGDQTKIRNLKKELARENEDKAIADKKNEDRRDEDLKAEEEKYDGRLLALQKELDAAEALEKKHSADVMKWRNLLLLDYIEEQKRQYTERMAQLQEQMSEIKSNAEEQISANGDVNTSIAEVIAAEEERRTHSIWSAEGVAAAWLDSADTIIWAAGELKKWLVESWDTIKWAIQLVVDLLEETDWYNIGLGINNYLTSAFEGFLIVLTKVDEKFKEFVEWVTNKGKKISGVFKGIAGGGGGGGAGGAGGIPTPSASDMLNNFMKGLFGIKEYANGGVIPGSPNQAIPIIAHGGETITPAGQSASNITVNINNPSVRNDNDITRIANQVEQVLSRRTFLKQLT